MAYSLLHDSEQQDAGDQSIEDETDESYKHSIRHNIHWFAILWLLSLACTYIFTRWYYVSRPWNTSPCIERVAALDYNSPIYKDIDLHLDAVTHNSTLWDDGTSIYRQDPSPESDSAWASLSKIPPVLISESDMEQLGLSTDGAVRWPDDPTGQTYVAQLDIFHLVHCVDALRRGTFFKHYLRKELNPEYWVHQKHCLDILRQELMCTGSLNLYRLIWQEHQERPIPDFTIHRQCRRWDDILDWQEKHQISYEDTIRLDHMRKPEGEYAYPMPPAGLKLVEEVDAWYKKFGIIEDIS